jgi:hypothetical protein
LEINPHEFNEMSKSPDKTFRTNSSVEQAVSLYNSATISSSMVEIYALPTQDQVTVYSNVGPPLWKIFNCFNYDKLILYNKEQIAWDNDRSFLNKCVVVSILSD